MNVTTFIHPALPLTSPVLSASGFRLVRQGEYYTVEYAGGVAHLKASVGLRLLKRLVSSPGREYHALDLVGSDGGAVDTGDAGAQLDPRAIAEYKRRLEDLREAAREAEAFGDLGRRARAQSEIAALACELARGVGLGGRERRAAAAAERARINVQRRVRDAIRRIERELPELGRHLAWAVKTGVYSSYSPERRS